MNHNIKPSKAAAEKVEMGAPLAVTEKSSARLVMSSRSKRAVTNL
jgi:hypothetical protein